MSRKAVRHLVLVALLVIAVASIWGLFRYYANLPQHLSQHETIVLGQDRLVPGSQAALRVLVRDSKDGSPLADAAVRVELKPESGGPAVRLFEGQTGPGGTAEVAFRVPPDAAGAGTLVVRTASSLGQDAIERPVTVERAFRVLLSTDKPIYQPGQVIHVRALALSAFDLLPAAGQPLEITIADGKGNKVFRERLATSDYGVAFTDFQLAGEVNTGAYKISALLGEVSSEKTVTVEHYVLPKFAVDLQTGQSYYQPGQHVEGTLQARYFFGKPVDEAQVRLEGYTFDVDRASLFVLEGQTDGDGNFTFTFDLPAYLAGSDLENGLARVYLEAAVTDQARHTEVSNLSLPVAASALVIDAVPEGGTFRPGVENILYVLASYPDGAPAEAGLRITINDTGQVLEAETGPYGLAEVRFTPTTPYLYLYIDAADPRGNTAQQAFEFAGSWTEESILLRPDRPVYTVGETMQLTILTSTPRGTVYLDVVREGQTVSTRAVDVSDGRAEVAVDLAPDQYGTLELHAYKVLPSGSITRDTRLVVVSQAGDLQISLKPGQETYRPGDQATLALQVRGTGGEGVQSAIGLAIVDESVFALAESDPGFAKLYFLLEQEILQPRYDLHGYGLPDLVGGLPETDPALERAASLAAQASLSEAVRGGGAGFSLSANSREDAMQRAAERQRAFFTGFSWAAFALFLAIPLAIAGLCVAALLREKSLRGSIWPALAILSLCALAVTLVPSPHGSYGGPLGNLAGWLDWLGSQGASWLVGWVVASLASYLGLLVMAIYKKDALLGWTLALLPLFAGSLVLLLVASQFARFSPGDEVAVAALVAICLIPLALLLRLAGFFHRRRIAAGLLLLPLTLFLAGGFLPLLASSGNVMTGAAQPALRADADFMALEGGALPVEAPMAAAGVVEEKMGEAAAEKPAVQEPEAQGTGAEPPHLRQFFPETMLWLPDAVTDAGGALALDLPVADSITTWRMTALASSRDGRLGSATASLRVFQDFFIDLDLPLSLTVGDEVAIPVGVFNYLPGPQTVRLELEQADWFELQGEPVHELEIAANDVGVAYFRVRALRFGMQPFKVTALGSQMSDAILKEVRVYPDGKEIRFSHSDQLVTGQPARQTVDVPADAIPGTQKLLVKVYPGVLSQVVEGLDSILRMPYGCFEQTSSTTYPNVLVLDYLKTTRQAAPEVQLKAEEYINLGYQRLTTFEVQSSGGFSLFGDAPADRMLTAYGLQEFSDMARVQEVDPDLIRRAANWLFEQQAGDGSWENDQGLVHENSWSSLGNDRLPVTAYITWSLVEAGFGDDERTQQGLQYVREYQSQADDPYVLALVANALVAADLQGETGAITDSTAAVLDRLAGMAQRDGQGAFWQSNIATFMGSEGQTGSIETTALAALALLRADHQPELGNAALLYLVQQKDSFGTWHSTQATVLALKALLQSVRVGGEQADATVTITLNGGQEKTLSITPENFDVVQMVSFDDVNPGRANTVEVRAEGSGRLMYQVTGSYYLPWEKLALYPEIAPREDLLAIDLAYDRTELAVSDTVGVNVTVSLGEPGAAAESALIDLGVPPGFSVETADLDALVARFDDVPEDYGFATIERYELTGRQVLVYVSNLRAGQPLSFSYRLRARFPLSVRSPASSAYDYYNPQVSGETPPQRIVVKP
jgi:uncharacterized protein YfaS (alpha-2-macroglobulin family)